LIHFSVFILTVLIVEIFIRSKFSDTVASTVFWSAKAHRVLLSARISDHWKEVAVPAYSINLASQCLRILLIIGLMICCVLVTDFLVAGILVHIMSIIGLVESLVVSIVYFQVRRKLVNNQ